MAYLNEYAGKQREYQGLGPFTNAGPPLNGVTLANVAEKGATLIDTVNGKEYINTGTKASPTWTVTGTQT